MLPTGGNLPGYAHLVDDLVRESNNVFAAGLIEPLHRAAVPTAGRSPAARRAGLRPGPSAAYREDVRTEDRWLGSADWAADWAAGGIG